MPHGTRLPRLIVALVAALTLSAGLAAQDPAQPEPDRADQADRHRVKGDIRFSYDYAETLAAAKENGRAIFAYFTFAT